MTQSNHEGYRYLQVYRPVTNRPQEFLSSIALLGLRLFGEQPSTSIKESGMDFTQSTEGGLRVIEPATNLTTVNQPVLDIYRPSDLRLLLLRRTVSTLMGGRYNLNSQAAHFTASQPKEFRPKSGRMYTKGPKNPVRSDFHDISRSYGENPNSLVVTFDHIQEIQDRGFGRELALEAKVGSVSSDILFEESEYCTGIIEDLAPRTANPSSPITPVVPFMKVPERQLNGNAKERFLDLIYDKELKILPVVLVLGEMWANSDTIAGTGA